MNIGDFEKVPKNHDLILTAGLPRLQSIYSKSDDYLVLRDGDVKAFGDKFEKLILHIPLEGLIDHLAEIVSEMSADQTQQASLVIEKWYGDTKEWDWYISALRLPPGQQSKNPETVIRSSQGIDELRLVALALIREVLHDQGN